MQSVDRLQLHLNVLQQHTINKRKLKYITIFYYVIIPLLQNKYDNGIPTHIVSATI